MHYFLRKCTDYKKDIASFTFPTYLVVFQVLSCIWLFVTPWTVAHQAPLFMWFLGKNTGVGCHSLLQGIFLTQGSNLGILNCRLILYQWTTRIYIFNSYLKYILNSYIYIYIFIWITLLYTLCYHNTANQLFFKNFSYLECPHNLMSQVGNWFGIGKKYHPTEI